MAERRIPGFTIPLGFYDGPEVKSIPRRIRAAAIGVWALCGTFSANKLLDGYVDAETLKDLGCTDAIRAALMATKGPDGELDPLWIDGRDGGVQFTKWVKYQRSRAEVKAYREQDAERKRAERNGTRNGSTSTNGKVSERTSNGNRSDERTPKTESETESITTTHPEHAESRNVDDERGQERGRSNPVDPSASRLVATLIPGNMPAAVKTALRLAASQLIVRDGIPVEIVAEALRRWATRPDAGPGLLPHIVADILRESATGGRPPDKTRAWAELAAELEHAELATARRELT